MGIVVLGAVFVDVKGYPLSAYIPGGRNVGRVEQVPGGVSRNVVEDIANVELRPRYFLTALCVLLQSILFIRNSCRCPGYCCNHCDQCPKYRNPDNRNQKNK